MSKLVDISDSARSTGTQISFNARCTPRCGEYCEACWASGISELHAVMQAIVVLLPRRDDRRVVALADLRAVHEFPAVPLAKVLLFRFSFSQIDTSLRYLFSSEIRPMGPSE